MIVLNKILEFIASLINSILPTFGFSDSFMVSIDGAFAFMIGLYQGASYFLPLNVIVACFTVIILVNNWALLFRVGQFVLKMVRG